MLLHQRGVFGTNAHPVYFADFDFLQSRLQQSKQGVGSYGQLTMKNSPRNRHRQGNYVSFSFVTIALAQTGDLFDGSRQSGRHGVDLSPQFLLHGVLSVLKALLIGSLQVLFEGTPGVRYWTAGRWSIASRWEKAPFRQRIE